MKTVLLIFVLTCRIFGMHHEDLLIYDPTEDQLQELMTHKDHQTQVYEEARLQLQQLHGIQYARSKQHCLKLQEIASLEKQRYDLYVQIKELKKLKYYDEFGKKSSVHINISSAQESMRINRVHIIAINAILRRVPLSLYDDWEISWRVSQRNPSIVAKKHFAMCQTRAKLMEYSAIPSPQDICDLLCALELPGDITPENSYEKFNSITKQQLRDHIRQIWDLSKFKTLYENQDIFDQYKDDFRWLELES